MKNRRHPSCTLVLAMLVACSLISRIEPISADDATDETLMASADQRIEQYRKIDVRVTVRDRAGNPIPGATVKVRQTRHAFLFGCNIFGWEQRDEQLGAAYRKQFKELLNFATLPFYWPSYEREKGKPDYERSERVARWCRENGIATKGHPLAWNYADAPWFPADSEELRRLQMERIDDCVSRFVGLIDRWDVVNEVTHFDRDEMVK